MESTEDRRRLDARPFRRLVEELSRPWELAFGISYGTVHKGPLIFWSFDSKGALPWGLSGTEFPEGTFCTGTESLTGCLDGCGPRSGGRMMGEDEEFPLENVRRCKSGFVGTSRVDDTEETDPERCSELGGEPVGIVGAMDSGLEVSTDFSRGLPSSFNTEVWCVLG